jgi:hypothetical protein
MRLILHIGTAKTGTTTLQTTLKDNAGVLEDAGVLYPDPPQGRTNHNLITTVLGPTARIQREFAALAGRDEDGIRALGRRYWDDLRRQVESSREDVVLLSGEYFYGLREDEAIELEKLVRQLSSDIDVVCYVRNPADYYVSMLQQQVKASHTIRRPSQFKMRAEVCLSRFRDIFDGRVDVRSAQPEALAAGDIVHDFLAAYLPQVDPGSLVRTRRLNASMSAEAMCIMQLVRRHGWPEEDGVFAPESNLVIDALNGLRETAAQTEPRLRPEIHSRFLRKHRQDLDFLAEQFGVELGTADLADDAGPEPPPGWDSDHLTELLDVDRDAVERVLYQLVRELAARSAAGAASGRSRATAG